MLYEMFNPEKAGIVFVTRDLFLAGVDYLDTKKILKELGENVHLRLVKTET